MVSSIKTDKSICRRAHHRRRNDFWSSEKHPPIAREYGRAQPRNALPFPDLLLCGCFHTIILKRGCARNSHCIENTQSLYLLCALPQNYDFLGQFTERDIW